MTGVEAAAATGKTALTARDRLARVAASADFAVQGLCFGGVITQVPKLVDKFQLTDVQLTVVMASVPFIAGLGSIVAGMVAPRTGSAFVLRSATAGVSLFAIAVGLANSLGLLYAAVALFGFFVGGVDASMNMQGVAVQRRYGRSILASCHAWWSIAGIAAALAASQANAVSVAAFLVCAGVVGLLLALSAGPSLLPRQAEDAADEEPNPVLPPVPDPPSTASNVPSSPTLGPRAHSSRRATAHQGRVVLLIGIAVMIMFIGDSGASQWSTIYLQKQLMATDRVVPLGFAAYLAFQLLGRTVADWVIGRIGAIATLITGALVAAGGFAVVVLAPVPAVAIGGFALVGAGLSVVVPLAFSAADALDPAGTGTVIARVNLFNYAGVVLGAALVGVVGGSANYRVAFAVPGVLVLLICAVAPSFRLAGAAQARSTAAR